MQEVGVGVQVGASTGGNANAKMGYIDHTTKEPYLLRPGASITITIKSTVHIGIVPPNSTIHDEQVLPKVVKCFKKKDHNGYIWKIKDAHILKESETPVRDDVSDVEKLSQSPSTPGKEDGGKDANAAQGKEADDAKQGDADKS